MLQADSLLGSYKILRPLGSGGMADVYEAEDQKLGRRVALKVLPPEFGRNPQLVTRFEKEVRAAAALNHHGIVTVFEVGRDQGVHYFSMRLLTGGDLRSRIDKGLTPLEAMAILREVADAFGHAHARGFVHRDVKPENIIFDEDGYPVLTDFGIAKALDAGTRVTATGVSIGTPRYISPEQARGRAVDARADLYSLGVILFEMLTGKPAYDGDEALAVIFKHVTEPIPKLPEIHAAMQPLIDKLMAKEPDQRPASAKELIKLVDTFMPGAATQEQRVVTTQQNPLIQKFMTPRTGTQTVLDSGTRAHAKQLAEEETRQKEEAKRRQAEEQERQRKAEEDAERERRKAEDLERKEQERQRKQEQQQRQEEERRRKEALDREKAAVAAKLKAEEAQRKREAEARKQAEKEQRLRMEREARAAAPPSPARRGPSRAVVIGLWVLASGAVAFVGYRQFAGVPSEREIIAPAPKVDEAEPKQLEEEARRQATAQAEEAAKRAAEEQAARLQAEQDAAAKKTMEAAEARTRMQQDAAANKAREEQAARQKMQEQEAQRQAAQDARRRAEQQSAEQKAADQRAREAQAAAASQESTPPPSTSETDQAPQTQDEQARKKKERAKRPTGF
jgi:tRNA A-37 threonylcarbamoyl transferase component Bud32